MSRQPFNTRWAQGVESEDNMNSFKSPGDVRISTGWEGGQDKDAPPAGQENWWHNRVDSGLQGVERRGVMDWHSAAIYGIGSPTYAEDGNYYESLVPTNSGNNPVSTTGFWRYRGKSFFSGHEPGDLKMVAHNNVPSSGWLKCNGAVLSRASYELLFSAIGTIHNTGGETSLQFRLPDYRGEFVRGFDDRRGVDVGRTFGSSQADSIKAHTHSMPTPLNFPLAHDSSSEDDTGVSKTINGAVTGSTGGSETRPRNKTVNYWIKY